ncbi:amino acid ABC transporter substrate-binding protein [Radicibacter daui]|uniref:amino acid ABC transporter substrate-binding protein n=1 Tax=Radicibacter daui TaxID=3064829 RepID=UPI004046EC08
MKKFGLAVLAASAMAIGAGAAHAGTTLDAIKSRGSLKCGVSTGLAGFSIADSQGKWTGIDVDYCRALATAIFGDASKVEFSPLTAQQRFTALQSGEIDVLSRNTTWTITRDASLGLEFAGVNFYDGQGFLVKKSLGVESAKQLDGATVCIQPGTTTELNLADYFRANNMSFKPFVAETDNVAAEALQAGSCDVYTTDRSGLAATRASQLANPADYVILPEVISKEPLGPVVRRGDDDFFTIAKWTMYALLETEEFGINSKNVDEMAKSTNPGIQRLLGVTDQIGSKVLGVDDKWVYNIIKQVGNYGEMYERDIVPIGLDKRGVNDLWTKGGLMYAPPIR